MLCVRRSIRFRWPAVRQSSASELKTPSESLFIGPPPPRRRFSLFFRKRTKHTHTHKRAKSKPSPSVSSHRKRPRETPQPRSSSLFFSSDEIRYRVSFGISMIGLDSIEKPLGLNSEPNEFFFSFFFHSKGIFK